MASFQAKISWERLRKKEKKNHFNDFLPDPQQKIKKKQEKNSKKLKNNIVASFQAKISQGRLRKRENKKKIKKKNRSNEFLLDS